MSEKTILIIDDDPYLLLALPVRLRANGYRVICAPDAASGLAVARKELPDLIILDLRLPAASDGLLLLQQIRNTTELMTTPAIVLSSADAAGNERCVLDAGATAFFQKPPVNREMLAAIRKALAEVIGRLDTPHTTMDSSALHI
jgi:DNA-binding response OmpR family regulator